MVQKPSLSQLLVAQPGQLSPFAARAQTVAMPQGLPQNLRFGNSAPGFPQSSRFTGGVVNPQAAVNFNAPPDFVAPTYSNSYSPGAINPILPSIAALLLGAHSQFHPPAPPAQPPAVGQTGVRTVAPPVPSAQPPTRAQAQPGQVSGFTPHSVGYPDATRQVAAPGQFPVPPRVSAGNLANPAIGRRGVYQV